MNLDVLNRIYQVLDEEEFNKLKEELEQAVKKYNSKDATVRKEGIDEVDGICHIRSFGDVKVNCISMSEWRGLLNQLRSSL